MTDDTPRKRQPAPFETVRDPQGCGGTVDENGRYVVRNVSKTNRRRQLPGGDVARDHDTDPFGE